MKVLNKILNCLVFASIIFVIVNGQRTTVNGLRSTDYGQQPKFILDVPLENVNKYYENADSISLEDINYYNVFENGDLVGKIINTSPCSDEIYGYNSITPLNIYLDSEDKIVEVEVCENRESRGYLNKVINSGFLDLWDGMTPEESANHHVDAVSGCTFSSMSIAQSLQARMQWLSQQEARYSLDWKLLARQSCVLLVTILATICFFMPKRKILRKITLLLSIIVLGFWTNSLLSLALFCNWLTNGVSIFLQIPVLLVAVLAIILPLFTKRSFYCQYLCPFGAAQEFAGKLGRRTTINGQRSEFRVGVNSLFKIFSILRKVILIVLLMIFAFGTGLDLSVVEPFPIFNYQSIGFGIAIFAAVILIVSIFVRRPWCNYLCPTGTLLEMFRKVRNGTPPRILRRLPS